jgi:hypothetical protein
MSRTLLIYLVLGGTTLVFFVCIGYWCVNSFVKQFTDRCLQQFKQQLAHETESAMKMFRDAVCEQIVSQENRSDSLGKLYATLIDLLRVGKEFNTSYTAGQMTQADKMLVGVRNTSESFSESYQKLRLHFSDTLCSMLDSYLIDQKEILESIERTWYLARRNPEAKIPDSVKQSWLHLEDRVRQVMDSMRSEFLKRQGSSAGVLATWMKQESAARNVAMPAAKK